MAMDNYFDKICCYVQIFASANALGFSGYNVARMAANGSHRMFIVFFCVMFLLSAAALYITLGELKDLKAKEGGRP